MSNRNTPVSTVLIQLVAALVVGVSIAVVWGLDWRWIPTVVLGGLLVLFLGGYVDSQLERRAKRRVEAKRAELFQPGSQAGFLDELGKQGRVGLPEYFLQVGKDQTER